MADEYEKPLETLDLIPRTTKLVLLGGNDENQDKNDQCWILDTHADTWKELTKLPKDMSKFPLGIGACVMGKDIILTGGNDVLFKQKSAWVYDMLTHEWQRLPAMTQSRVNHGIVAVQPYVYVFGGDKGSSVERLDMSSRDNWELMTPVLGNAHTSDAIAVDGWVYVLGRLGHILTLAYNLDGNSWERKADMPLAKEGSAVGVDKNIYVVGAGKCMKYSTETNIWEVLCKPIWNHYHCAAVCLKDQTTILLTGGYCERHLDNMEEDIEEYNIEHDKWKCSKLALPKPLIGHCLLSCEA